MNITIKINGDIHIHCDSCGDCGIYDDDFNENIGITDEDASDGTELAPEEAEAILKAVAGLIYPLLRAETDD
jgi:hypothetical protein